MTLMAQYSAFPIWEQAALVERVLVERRAMQSNGIAAGHLGISEHVQSKDNFSLAVASMPTGFLHLGNNAIDRIRWPIRDN